MIDLNLNKIFLEKSVRGYLLWRKKKIEQKSIKSWTLHQYLDCDGI